MTGKGNMADHLTAHGVRPTRQRLAIAETLFEGTGRHIDASGLYEELATSATKVSLATVYNALRAFDQAGLVRRVALPSVWYDTDTSNHHHFFVVTENRVIDIDVPDAKAASPKIPDGYRVSRIDTVIHLVPDDGSS
jgi:Fur family iron response transcriptional regulator